MKIKGPLIAAVYATVLLFAIPALAQVKNNCLMCHTNENLMKSMYKPPVLEKAEEGEG
jgi:hypothetical protein